MKLSELLGPLGVLVGGPDADVRGISIDSRTTAPGDVFVAIRGGSVDGHRFVAAAEERGAAAIVTEEPVRTEGAINVVVDDTRIAAALIASRLSGEPAKRLRLSGVTGTNGKTSTTHLLKSILSADGRRSGIIGTVGYGVETLAPATHTTPDATVLHSILKDFVDQNCFEVVMEVSSHAVRQHRVWGLDYELGILTNVTHDHLDYHSDYDDYLSAKREFCESARTLVYWADDAAALGVGQSLSGSISVGTGADCDVSVTEIETSLEATRFALRLKGGDRVEVESPLLGTFVSTNAALAAAGAECLGVGVDAIVAGLEHAPQIPGRFETFGGGSSPVVIVDYSHTADAMERVLDTCRRLGAARVLTVFGCGGDRDAQKRPIMGRAAEERSDVIYLTMDNPRTERLEDINADVLSGMADPSRVNVIDDRAVAIKECIASAGPGDVVAVLGKGHENYQIVGDTRFPFDDRVEAKRALDRWSNP